MTNTAKRIVRCEAHDSRLVIAWVGNIPVACKNPTQLWQVLTEGRTEPFFTKTPPAPHIESIKTAEYAAFKAKGGKITKITPSVTGHKITLEDLGLLPKPAPAPAPVKQESTPSAPEPEASQLSNLETMTAEAVFANYLPQPSQSDHSGHNWHICDDPVCQICSNSIDTCEICGGHGASLTSECPGIALTPAQQAEVSSGCLDFIRGQWSEKSATSAIHVKED